MELAIRPPFKTQPVEVFLRVTAGVQVKLLTPRPFSPLVSTSNPRPSTIGVPLPTKSLLEVCYVRVSDGKNFYWRFGVKWEELLLCTANAVKQWPSKPQPNCLQKDIREDGIVHEEPGLRLLVFRKPQHPRTDDNPPELVAILLQLASEVEKFVTVESRRLPPTLNEQAVAPLAR